MGLEHELRSVSDELLTTLEQLVRLEGEKRAEQPGTPRFISLAREVERLAALAFTQTSSQHTLAEMSQVAVRRGADLVPIEEMDPVRDVSVILAEWRDSERVLAASSPETAAHAKAAADVQRLRDEYHRAYNAQRPSGGSDSTLS